MFFPTKYYVGIRSWDSVEYGGQFPLGFPTPEGNDSGAMKRKTTVENWTNTTVWENDPETKKGMNVKKKGTFTVIDNVPVEGFRLVGDVKRYGGWFSTGNVVWRVEDPRGFQFEISSANLGALMSIATIDQGLIQGKCLYARDGARNALIIENSEEYQATLATTNRRDSASKLSLKTIKPCTPVSLVDGRMGIYYGTVWILGQYTDWIVEESRPGVYSFSNYKAMEIKTEIKDRYLVIVADGTVELSTKPPIANVVVYSEQLESLPKTVEQACDYIVDKRAQVMLVKKNITTIYASPQKFTENDIQRSVEKGSFSDIFEVKKVRGAEAIVLAKPVLAAVQHGTGLIVLPAWRPERYHDYMPAELIGQHVVVSSSTFSENMSQIASWGVPRIANYVFVLTLDGGIILTHAEPKWPSNSPRHQCWEIFQNEKLSRDVYRIDRRTFNARLDEYYTKIKKFLESWNTMVIPTITIRGQKVYYDVV
jgi:hypothetical protein